MLYGVLIPDCEQALCVCGETGVWAQKGLRDLYLS